MDARPSQDLQGCSKLVSIHGTGLGVIQHPCDDGECLWDERKIVPFPLCQRCFDLTLVEDVVHCLAVNSQVPRNLAFRLALQAFRNHCLLDGFRFFTLRFWHGLACSGFHRWSLH